MNKILQVQPIIRGMYTQLITLDSLRLLFTYFV